VSIVAAAACQAWGFGGNFEVAPSDVTAPALAYGVAKARPGWRAPLSSLELNNAGKAAVNPSGLTQFRIRPDPPTNGDNAAQYLVVNSGKSPRSFPRVVARLCRRIDECPADSRKVFAGVCGCGVPDDDTDRDGAADCLDYCPTDASKTTPGRCGCGVAETDSDGDGAPNCVDSCPTDRSKVLPGVCGCGASDVDGDGDGFVCADECPRDPLKTSPGVCGCGAVDTSSDGDGDGVIDCSDGCPTDTFKTSPGMCGCGVLESACASCFRFGYAELLFTVAATVRNPFLNVSINVAVTLPSGALRTISAFYNGVARGSRALLYMARVYCGENGVYTWRLLPTSVNVTSLNSTTLVSASTLTPANWPGKLRRHPADNTQFVYDNGEDFVHIGACGR
jgi:hypothetical protein